MKEHEQQALEHAADMKRNGDKVFGAVVVWAVESGALITDIAKLTGYSRQTVHTIVNEAARERERKQ